MNPSNLKGKFLEYAVLNIESLIFKSPFRKDEAAKNIRILPNYKKISGYEIDLYVIVERDKNLDGIFIFECKNWDAKIGRKEISDFSEKITKSSAQKGFFIAQEFTKDAIARANDDARLELVYWQPSLQYFALVPIINIFDSNNVKVAIQHELIKENIFSIKDRGHYFSYRCHNDGDVDLLTEITTVQVDNRHAPSELAAQIANKSSKSLIGIEQGYKFTNRSGASVRIELIGSVLLSDFLTRNNFNH